MALIKKSHGLTAWRSESVPGACLEGWVHSADGCKVFYRYWPAAKEEWAVLLVLHGIGLHSEPYGTVAQCVSDAGVAVYAFDARGHGRSPVERGVPPTAEESRMDVDAMLAGIRGQHPNSNIFLLGESMGGAYALSYVAQSQAAISGTILLAPALRLRVGQVLRGSTLALLPYLLFAWSAPCVDLTGERLEECCRDPEFVRWRRSDRLGYDKVSIRYLWRITRITARWRSRLARRVRGPMLLVHGLKDLLLSPQGSEELARLAPASAVLLEYGEARHTLLWDPDTPDIFREVLSWMLKSAKR